MTELRAALQDALGPLYRVEREVRPVGDCRLFVALERPSGPELLVKVLPGQLSLAVDSGVFEREVLLLAPRLGQPGLVTPKGAGRAGSFVYHTRPFVAGTTLRAWLARHGEFPLRQAVTILRDVLAGLAHAHAAGVAHGDLRPEHVLLADDGSAQLADAGIVDAVGRSLPGGAPGAAEVASAALCAAPYLAPEHRPRGGGDRGGQAAITYSLWTRPLAYCRVPTCLRTMSRCIAPNSGIPEPMRTGTRVIMRRWMSPAWRNR